MIGNELASQPPLFLKLLSHPLRWQMLKALAVSDLRVSELIRVVAQPQNVVSYHIARLRAEKVIRARRSAADARELYYCLDLDRVRALFFASGSELHPALQPEEPPVAPKVDPVDRRVRVLFLCTHNSARSQIAEGILRHLSKGQVDVYSAGTEPSTIHPMAIRVLLEQNIESKGQYAKSVDRFSGELFDYVVTVCDRARETCPVFPGAPSMIHWSFPDPAGVVGDEETLYAAFRETALQLTTRISYLLMVIRRNQIQSQ